MCVYESERDVTVVLQRDDAYSSHFLMYLCFLRVSWCKGKQVGQEEQRMVSGKGKQTDKVSGQGEIRNWHIPPMTYGHQQVTTCVSV